jgi:hypothetical protein
MCPNVRHILFSEITVNRKKFRQNLPEKRRKNSLLRKEIPDLAPHFSGRFFRRFRKQQKLIRINRFVSKFG